MQLNRTSFSHRLALISGLLIFGVLSCKDPASPNPLGPGARALYSDVGCWPIGPNCTDRPLTTDENDRFVRMTGGIDEGADPRCAQIKSKLADDLSLGHVHIWTDAPNGYYGDRHNVPDITHMTTWGLGQGLVEQKNTLIHETAHAILGDNNSDMVADSLMGICFGVLETTY